MTKSARSRAATYRNKAKIVSGRISQSAAERIRKHVGALLSSTSALESESRAVRIGATRLAHGLGLASHVPAHWQPHEDDIKSPTAHAFYVSQILTNQGRLPDAKRILDTFTSLSSSAAEIFDTWRVLCGASAAQLASRWQLPAAEHVARDVLTQSLAVKEYGKLYDLIAGLPGSHAELSTFLDRIASQQIKEGYSADARGQLFAEYFRRHSSVELCAKSDALLLLEYFEEAAATGDVAAEIAFPSYNLALRQLISASLSGSSKGVEGISPLFERGASDYMTNLDQRLADWRRSPPYKHLVASECERREARRNAHADRVERPDAPLRVLIVGDGNWHFIGAMLGPLAEAGIQTRTYSFERLSQLRFYKTAHLYSPSRGLPSTTWMRHQIRKTEPMLSELIEWSDVVLVEWCNATALWFSRFLDERKKLVVRLHSYEAFSHWPFTANWGGVDGLVFVADTVRGFFNAQHGERVQGVSQITLPNINHLETDRLKLSDERRFTLGMASYATSNKNPILALEILRELRKRDARWKMRFIGSTWQADVAGSEAAYRDEFLLAAQADDIVTALTFEPFRLDLLPWYNEVGFILSCSDREGTHEALREGMAAGAVPIVRNWPMLKSFGGAKAVYPDLHENIFEEVQTAVDIILRQQSRFADAAAEAQAMYRANYSADVVAQQYSTFLRNVYSQ